MAKNVIINGVTYASTPQVDIPKADGSGDATFYDTSAANLSANDLRVGKTAFGANGSVQGNLATVSQFTENITSKAQEISIPAGIHSTGSVVKIAQASQNALVPGNIRKGVSILGVDGDLSSATIVQDSSTKVLRIS